MKLYTRKKVSNRDTGNNLHPTLITKEMFISGEITCLGDIKIDGSFKGNVVAEGKIILGENGHIEGNLMASQAILNGTFEGNIKCTGLLIIATSAVVSGELCYDQLKMDAGSNLRASVQKLEDGELQIIRDEMLAFIKKTTDKSKVLQIVKDKAINENIQTSAGVQKVTLVNEDVVRKGAAGSFSGW